MDGHHGDGSCDEVDDACPDNPNGYLDTNGDGPVTKTMTMMAMVYQMVKKACMDPIALFQTPLLPIQMKMAFWTGTLPT